MESQDHEKDVVGCAEDRGDWDGSGGRLAHDQAWKAMFRCAPMMASLIREFVEPKIVAALDLSGLALRPCEMFAADMRTLRADLVWRVPRSDHAAFLHVSVEFQSSVDVEMPVRMSDYANRLSQAADPGELPPGRTPPAYPVVVHTGSRRWTAETALEATWSLEGQPPEAAALLAPYQGFRRFRLLSLPDMDARELEGKDGIAARLFRLARARTLDDARAALIPFLERLLVPELAVLWNPVMDWIRHVFLPMPASGGSCRRIGRRGACRHG